MANQNTPAPRDMPTPAYTFEGEPTEQQQLLLVDLNKHLETDPDALLSAFNVYAAHAEATGRVLDFLSVHADGVDKLELSRRILESKTDQSFEFDDATEEALSADPDIKAAVKKIEAGGLAAEEASGFIRRQRFRLFLGRRATAHRLQLKAIETDKSSSTTAA